MSSEQTFSPVPQAAQVPQAPVPAQPETDPATKKLLELIPDQQVVRRRAFSTLLRTIISQGETL